MVDKELHKSAAPLATVEYELTDDVARQMALDLVAHRIVLPPSVRIPAFRGVSPVVVLLAAAAQIVIALAVLLLLSGWDWIVTKLLAAASVLVIGILLWKAAFYGLPSFARWYASRRAVRDARASSSPDSLASLRRSPRDRISISVAAGRMAGDCTNDNLGSVSDTQFKIRLGIGRSDVGTRGRDSVLHCTAHKRRLAGNIAARFRWRASPASIQVVQFEGSLVSAKMAAQQRTVISNK